ncbi:MAG: hypothetical protein GY820_38860, partial [Gammaproteobacteria bacterium]|nr:hypothetical protein [Gammaproteobacteria bacterium]
MGFWNTIGRFFGVLAPLDKSHNFPLTQEEVQAIVNKSKMFKNGTGKNVQVYSGASGSPTTLQVHNMICDRKNKRPYHKKTFNCGHRALALEKEGKKKGWTCGVVSEDLGQGQVDHAYFVYINQKGQIKFHDGTTYRRRLWPVKVQYGH